VAKKKRGMIKGLRIKLKPKPSKPKKKKPAKSYPAGGYGNPKSRKKRLDEAGYVGPKKKK